MNPVASKIKIFIYKIFRLVLDKIFIWGSKHVSLSDFPVSWCQSHIAVSLHPLDYSVQLYKEDVLINCILILGRVFMRGGGWVGSFYIGLTLFHRASFGARLYEACELYHRQTTVETFSKYA